ncbi:bacteriocin immunity protein [Pseudomonas chlororaphis]|uniref:Bacteriocin immunity protein n=1 Tax=Pseudomonas chlororaphis TaxID=587753 RepID=A0A1Q8ERS8_9PSED|nr:bacteriocin immunity protein [Pseudomonas chlororaphis]OLF54501.1 hypothetical protein BTN82_10870 [Pseudomonas chlororaphis]
MTTLRSCISEYTEQEFLRLLTEIREVSCQSEDEHSALVRHFRKISEHPKGSDLLFYPADNADDSPEGILKTVKAWRKANGLPGFKPPVAIAAAPPSTPPTSCSRSPRTRS